MKNVWNKGKAVGQMKPLTPKQVRMIKDALSSKGDLKSLRDLVLFSAAIDTMLRSVDLLSLRVEDVQDERGEIRDRFWILQQKTGKRHLVEISEGTREVLKEWISKGRKFEEDFLFTGTRKGKFQAISREQYALLVKKWIREFAQADPKEYSTHSLRRTKAALVYKRTGNIEAVRQLLGQHNVNATSVYLNVGQEDALAIAREVAGRL
jgi:integrase